MRRGRRWILPLAFSVLFLGAAASACPATQKEPSATEERAVQIFKWINFALLAGIVVYLCLKRGGPLFRANAEKTGAAINQATATKAEADRQLQEAKARLETLDQAVASLRFAAERDAKAEAERLAAMTRTEIEKIHLAGQAEVAAAERAARMDLKTLGAKLAVERAEALLVKQLTPQAQEALVNAFVQNLAGRPN